MQKCIYTLKVGLGRSLKSLYEALCHIGDGEG